MSGHTPGPYSIAVAPNSARYLEDKWGVVVASSLTQADAELFAAAPDLLAALEDCMLAFSAKNLKTQQFRALASQSERKARAAISKARATKE